MPILDKKKDKKLIETLQEENLAIAKKHLKRYASSAIWMNKPFGEVKDRMQDLIESILKEI